MFEVATSHDMALLTPVLEKYHNRTREALLPMLHDAQALYGWLPREVQVAISHCLRVPLADIHGVIEFYTMFYNRPMAKRVIRMCEGTSCELVGSGPVIDAVEAKLGLAHGESSEDGEIGYERVPCLGMCEHGPNALNGSDSAGRLSVEDVDAFIEGEFPEPKTHVYGSPLLALGRAGRIDPLSLADYESHGGYEGLKRALTLTPEALIEANKQGEILGRGGAMFPLGLKSQLLREAPGKPDEKHVVVNADESEPGTFKDRTLMEEDPFSLIEATTLVGYATGAENGWILVRGEYPRSFARLSHAVEKAREDGYLGRDILGKKGFHFDIELRLGAGAYICGEETALFEAVEGKRGFPRIKPPFPTTNGLFDQPTAINNVETLAMALAAFNLGIDEWCKLGTEKSPGTKLFCLSGHINRPGTYEIPFGMTIRELIEMAGGVAGNGRLQAVLIGGAAGAFIGPETLDMPLTYEDARANSVPLGSGSLVVMDESVDLRRVMLQLAEFFTHESCGKCFPCQLGTQRQMDILGRIAREGPKAADKRALLDIGFTMTETSLCGLGQTAASAVMSAIALWPELVE